MEKYDIKHVLRSWMNEGTINFRLTNKKKSNTLKVGRFGGIPTSDVEHTRSSNSKQFFTSHRWSNIPIGNTVILHMDVVGSKKVDAQFSVKSSGKIYADLLEDPTLSTNGTSLDLLCCNRDSIDTINVNMYRDPDVTIPGKTLEVGVLGSYGKKTIAGGRDTDDGYWFFDDGKSYLARFTNKAGNTIDVVSNVVLFECSD